MNTKHVIILFQNSLFAAGIASRLVEAGYTDVKLLDAGQSTSTDTLHEQHPDVIIYDSSDQAVPEKMSLFSFLRDFPGLHILQVDYEKEEVQIYHSQQKAAHEMCEVISLMQNITVAVD
jgi:AmiR/NasT family two-component response regulator